jgi:molybdenum cofactor biosynthesis protein MoaC
MRNVGDKPDSLRRARAAAKLYLPPECVAICRAGRTDKGDLFATARIAGILAAKRTDEILPLCHPLPIQAAELHFRIEDDHVHAEAEVQTLGPTGVEMEALTAVSIALLCLYDMLKPHTEQTRMRLGDCQLLAKTGGKSDHRRRLANAVPATLLALPGSRAGPSMQEALVAAGFAPVQLRHLDAGESALDAALQQALAARGPGLVITLGGVDPKGRAVACLRRHLDTELPGLMEAARAHAQRRLPQAMFSQGLAGLAGDGIALTLSGEPDEALRAWTALLPGLVHHFGLIGGPGPALHPKDP